MPGHGPTENQPGSYRIRWANVRLCNGRYEVRRRMCIAERKVRWFGWRPVTDADWRFDEERARCDIDHDKALRAPIPTPITVD